MKNFLFILLTCLTFLSSCKKDTGVSVDINGVWYGMYSNENVFKARITQSSDQYNGTLYIPYYSFNISGFLSNNKFVSHLNFNAVKVDIESLELSNSNAHGTFSTNIGLNGEWTGQKIAFGAVKTTLIGKISDFTISGCTSLHKVLWVYSNDDWSFHRIDSTGVNIGSLKYEHNVYDFTFDGEDIWIYDNYNGFTKIDVNGNILTSFKLKGYTPYTAIVAHNQALFCYNSETRKIYKLNDQGQKTDSVRSYFNLSDMEFDGGHFYLTDPDLKVVIQTDENFNFLKAYPVPEEGYSCKSAYFNGSIWYFINDYSNIPTESLLLYKITPQ